MRIVSSSDQRPLMVNLLEEPSIKYQEAADPYDPEAKQLRGEDGGAPDERGSIRCRVVDDVGEPPSQRDTEHDNEPKHDHVIA
ncbi:hypothetical protein ACX9NE_12850 [Mycobacterium sp. ML4]